MKKIARIVNTFGIKGQVKVIADTDFPERRFATGNQLMILKHDDVSAHVTMEKFQLHKGTYILTFKDHHHINQVESFKGAWLAIEDDQQHALEEDEYYHHQLIGLSVKTSEGRVIGKIKEILSLGSNDVWVIKRPKPGKKDALIPFISDVVKTVDLSNQWVIIDLMEGLIEDED